MINNIAPAPSPIIVGAVLPEFGRVGAGVAEPVASGVVVAQEQVASVTQLAFLQNPLVPEVI